MPFILISIIGLGISYLALQESKKSNTLGIFGIVLGIISAIATIIMAIMFIIQSLNKTEEYDVVNYYEDGTPHFTGNGLVEDKEGTWKYYSRDGIVIKVENYNDGQLDGIYKEFYKNGNLKISGEYDNGEVLLSNWKCFHMDGTIKECLDTNNLQ